MDRRLMRSKWRALLIDWGCAEPQRNSGAASESCCTVSLAKSAAENDPAFEL